MIDIICILIIIAGIFLLIKNEHTFRNQLIILEAIGEYSRIQISKELDFEVELIDMEPYAKTLFRLWDWGYTRILPKDKFEIIKPYIH